MRVGRLIRRSLAAILALVVVIGVVAWFRSTNACDRPAVTPARPMKAVIHCDFGSPEVLRIETVEKPVPSDSQVLVRVRAVALNPLDWHLMRGEPYFGRLGFGLRKPKNVRLGVDFAGIVEAVGPAVTRFKPGDEVYGGRTGALAEYVTIRETGSIAPKPANVSFEQAAGVAVAAITALQGLRDKGALQAGQRVLINGASGGVGTFAVQIAKAMGAEVTGVSSTRNVDLVRSIGADRVIDYTQSNFTVDSARYDLILDNVANHSLRSLRRVLEPEGRYVMVGAPAGKWISPLPRLAALGVHSLFADQTLVFFISELTSGDLDVLARMMETGQVTPVIDRSYPLSEVRAAMAHLETGRARGKVVVTME